ncbi:MAG: dihydropteroate synthase, partial [Chloroflexi bacterium]|nr:dihydropteroate synthase [Chloroflexota bacterium]
VDEALARLIPPIRTVRKETDLPISVDTYKARVAAAALDAGADFVNDVWGLRRDAEMAGVVAQAGCPVVITHNRRARPRIGSIGGHYPNSEYDDIVRDVIGDLTGQIDFATASGIDMDRIIVDPGIGFGKSPPQNLELIPRLAELDELGLPMMIGLSRKSFIGFALNDGNADRTSGTAAATALAILAGVDIIRVHDVRAMVAAARVADALARGDSQRAVEE